METSPTRLACVRAAAASSLRLRFAFSQRFMMYSAGIASMDSAEMR